MKDKKERINQTVNFLKWTKKYSGWWQLICKPDNEHMNLDMMKTLIRELAKEEFYEMIFVLLEVHKEEEFMKSLQNVMLKDLIISEWQNGSKDKIINKLIMYLE